MNSVYDETRDDELRKMIGKVAAATFRLSYLVEDSAQPASEEARRELVNELRAIRATLLPVLPKKRRRDSAEGF